MPANADGIIVEYKDVRMNCDQEGLECEGTRV